MKNLPRRLEKLEKAIPPPVDEWVVKGIELLERLLSSEMDTLTQALGNLKDGAATEEDHETIGYIFKLAQERIDAGLIIVRERKPPDQWNEEMRDALRLQRGTGGPWSSVNGYNEFLIKADVTGPIATS